MTRETPDLSIVIPTKNEEDTLAALLKDINGQDLKSGRNRHLVLEVIVADADSKDRTRKIAREYKVKIIDGGHAYFGRNQGVKLAKAPIVYLIDADIRLGKKFIKSSLAEFKKKNYDLAVMDNFPSWVGRENPFQTFILFLFYSLSNLLTRLLQRTPKPMAVSTCFIVKKDVYLKIGGFDEKIYCQGDTEIAERLVKQGYRLGVLQKSFIWASTRKPLKQGIFRYFARSVIIAHHRAIKGEIKSRSQYQRLTKEFDYFNKED